MLWKGVCFDLDNTLFSHEKAFKKAIGNSYYKLVAADIDKPHVPFEVFYTSFKRNSDLYWPQYESKSLSGTDYRRKRFCETMKEFGLPFTNELADMFHNHYYEVVDEYSEPYPGLSELFNFLSNKEIKLGIITNGMVDTQWGKVEKIGASRWIPKENVLISEEVGVLKPDKAIFQLMEKSLRLSPDKLLFIGDSWQHDVVGAMNAGWDAVFLNTRGEQRKTGHKPVAELNTLIEVKQLLINYE
ncbi:MAG: HAD family hydrolase [Bacillus sp. (in: Bacteria)]|nr:HAD family hydrolase [Bacillus sp. (in: firmicutes)]